MRNTSCIICKKEFAPRANKLYCSNACKQKGFTDKKHQAGEQQEITTIQQQFQFYYPEYEAYRRKYPNPKLSFILYCFFRKSLIEVSNIKQVFNYIISFGHSWWDDFEDRYNTGIISPARKKYLEFEEKYFSDETKIFFSQQTTKSE